MGGYVFVGVGRYIGTLYVSEQPAGANSTTMVTNQTLSVILLATEDEVIKFWKVSIKGRGRWGGMRSNERPSSCMCVVSKETLFFTLIFGSLLINCVIFYRYSFLHRKHERCCCCDRCCCCYDDDAVAMTTMLLSW